MDNCLVLKLFYYVFVYMKEKYHEKKLGIATLFLWILSMRAEPVKRKRDMRVRQIFKMK